MATLFGVFLAMVATMPSGHGMHFLQGSKLLHKGRVAKTTFAPVRTIYQVDGNFNQVRDKALAEFPSALISMSRTSEMQLVIPRIVEGRVSVASSPEHTIHLYQEGRNGTIAEIIDYRQPTALESAMLWIRDQLKI